jgi:hypothetical protein
LSLDLGHLIIDLPFKPLIFNNGLLNQRDSLCDELLGLLGLLLLSLGIPVLIRLGALVIYLDFRQIRLGDLL